MLTLEQRQARAFRYLCARPGCICIQDESEDSESSFAAWWEGPVVGEFYVCTRTTLLDAIEACVALIRARFDPEWGADCEPAAPDASMKEATHGD